MSSPFKPLSITESEGIAWTENWRNSSRSLAANSFLFSADEFRALLDEPGIEYIRLYVCLRLNDHNKLEEKLICVGADSQQKDMLGTASANQSTGIYDFSHPCPPLCVDDESPLGGGDVS